VGKRANGEGSVFKRADGRWSAEISYPDENGTSKRRTVYGATQAEVLTNRGPCANGSTPVHRSRTRR